MAEDKDPRLRPIETNPSKMREKAQQQLKDEAADEARRKRNLRLVQKAKVSEELDSLKKIKEAQLKTKPKSLLNQRKALIQATNLKTPTETNVKKILVKYGLRTVPIVGSLLSAFKSKPAGAGSSLDGK